jgi:hypothetical protein
MPNDDQLLFAFGLNRDNAIAVFFFNITTTTTKTPLLTAKFSPGGAKIASIFTSFYSPL